MSDCRPGRVVLIASLDGVKLRRPVVPGDQLRLEVSSRKIKSNAACVYGMAKVGDTLAAEAKLRFVMVNANRAAGSIESRRRPRGGHVEGWMRKIDSRIGHFSTFFSVERKIPSWPL